jgi:hypothetical protein
MIVAVVALFVFAFWQRGRRRPDDRPDHDQSVGGPPGNGDIDPRE